MAEKNHLQKGADGIKLMVVRDSQYGYALICRVPSGDGQAEYYSAEDGSLVKKVHTVNTIR